MGDILSKGIVFKLPLKNYSKTIPSQQEICSIFARHICPVIFDILNNALMGLIFETY